MYDQEVDGNNRHVGIGIICRNQCFRGTKNDIDKGS